MTSFDLRSLLASRRDDGMALLKAHINPVFARVLRTIGFDRTFVRALGPYAWDADNHRYLDFLGGYATVNMGRNHPVIRRALEDFLSLDHPTWMQFEAPLFAGLLAEQLVRRMPAGLDRVFFTNSGTEGVECAIKFARCATGRPGVVSTYRAFHGLSTGALGLNGDESFREGFGPFLPGFRQVAFNDLQALERELQRGDVGAFVVEPVQGKGVNLPAPGYLEQAAALCRRHGALFVADEVQTGIGRTGTFLAIEQEGDVRPDIVVLSKALSGGYVPVGAVMTRQEIWSRVFSSMDRAIVHSSTFHMGGLAMTAGLASLHVLDDEKLMENARRQGERLREGLEAMMPRFEFMHAVRQRGLMIGIELGQPRSLRLRAAWSMVNAMDRNLFAQAVVIPLMEDHRVITQVAGHGLPVVKLTPPLTITAEDVQWFLSAFEDVMQSLHRFPGPAWDVLRRLGLNTMGVGRGRRGRGAPDDPASAVASDSPAAVTADPCTVASRDETNDG